MESEGTPRKRASQLLTLHSSIDDLLTFSNSRDKGDFMVASTAVNWKSLRYVVRAWIVLAALLVAVCSLQVSAPLDKVNCPTASHQHTFILYRIIGNDLPPRHAPTQTIRNLKFIIQNEPEFDGVLKIWILNRLVNRSREQILINYLKQYGKTFLTIPFVVNDYAKLPLEFLAKMEPDFFFSDQYLKLGRNDSEMAQDSIYHLRNLYVMNNNGARNYALSDGKKRHAQWILPWDGNCYLTMAAWKEISTTLLNASQDVLYAYVPMMRLTNNADVLKSNLTVTAVDEPQLIFRLNSTLQFDPNMRYGRRSKVELLWRLGIMSSVNAAVYSWENQPSQTLVASPHVLKAGWVARLFSGKAYQEIAGSSRVRRNNRILGVRRLIDRLDERMVRKSGRFDNYAMTVFNESRMSIIKTQYWLGNTHISHTANLWIKTATIFSNYNSSIIRLDMSRNDGVSLLRRFFDSVIALTIRWIFTGETQYAEDAANICRQWLVDLISVRELVKVDGSLHGLSSHNDRSLLLFTYVTRVSNAYDKDLSAMTTWMAFPELLDSIRTLIDAKFLTKKDNLGILELTSDTLSQLSTLQPSFNRSLHLRSFFEKQILALSVFSDIAVAFYKVHMNMLSRASLILPKYKKLLQTLAMSCAKSQMGNNLVDVLDIYQFVSLASMSSRFMDTDFKFPMHSQDIETIDGCILNCKTASLFIVALIQTRIVMGSLLKLDMPRSVGDKIGYILAEHYRHNSVQHNSALLTFMIS